MENQTLSKVDSTLQEARRDGFCREIFQSQLTLWTFVGTGLWTFFWASKSKFTAFNIFFALPLAFGIGSVLSVFLFGAIVYWRVLGLLFWKSDSAEPEFDSSSSWISRRLSNASNISTVAMRKRSSSLRKEEELVRVTATETDSSDEEPKRFFWQRYVVMTENCGNLSNPLRSRR